MTMIQSSVGRKEEVMGIDPSPQVSPRGVSKLPARHPAKSAPPTFFRPELFSQPAVSSFYPTPYDSRNRSTISSGYWACYSALNPILEEGDESNSAPEDKKDSPSDSKLLLQLQSFRPSPAVSSLTDLWNEEHSHTDAIDTMEDTHSDRKRQSTKKTVSTLLDDAIKTASLSLDTPSSSSSSPKSVDISQGNVWGFFDLEDGDDSAAMLQ